MKKQCEWRELTALSEGEAAEELNAIEKEGGIVESVAMAPVDVEGCLVVLFKVCREVDWVGSALQAEPT